MANKVPNTIHNSFHAMSPRGMDDVIFFCCKEEADLRMSKLDIPFGDLNVCETRFGWVIEHDNGDYEDNYRRTYFGVQFKHHSDEFIGK